MSPVWLMACESGSDRKFGWYVLRAYHSRRSVGARPSENIGGKEAEAGNSMERVGDAGRRRIPMFAAGRSQDGLL